MSRFTYIASVISLVVSVAGIAEHAKQHKRRVVSAPEPTPDFLIFRCDDFTPHRDGEIKSVFTNVKEIDLRDLQVKGLSAGEKEAKVVRAIIAGLRKYPKARQIAFYCHGSFAKPKKGKIDRRTLGGESRRPPKKKESSSSSTLILEWGPEGPRKRGSQPTRSRPGYQFSSASYTDGRKFSVDAKKLWGAIEAELKDRKDLILYVNACRSEGFSVIPGVARAIKNGLGMVVTSPKEYVCGGDGIGVGLLAAKKARRQVDLNGDRKITLNELDVFFRKENPKVYFGDSYYGNPIVKASEKGKELVVFQY